MDQSVSPHIDLQPDDTMVLGREDVEMPPPTLPEAVPVPTTTLNNGSSISPGPQSSDGSLVLHEATACVMMAPSTPDTLGSSSLEAHDGLISMEASAVVPQMPTSKRKRGRPPKIQLTPIPASPILPVIITEPPCSSIAEPPCSTLPTPPASQPPPSSLDTPTAKVPKKRGRRSKAELLLIRASQALETSISKDQSIASEADQEQETTPSGRPRRRAAKSALRFLQELDYDWSTSGLHSPSKPMSTDPEEPVRKRRKKKDEDEDEDFVVSEDVLVAAEIDETENEALSEVSESEWDSVRTRSTYTPGEKTSPAIKGSAANGFPNSIMAPVWKATEVTMEYRDTNHSHWEFPEWIPNKESWHFLPSSEVETYLPSQATSPCFTVRREGVKQESETHTLGRFQSLPPHPERWDMTFFVGGPVWTLEWCPTIPGSGSCQFLALYCHKGMDDQTRIHVTKTGPALLQLWRLGTLNMESGGESAASFSYGLAVDQGCIWDLKFCPSGGWEPLSTPRKSSHMARLGLLAAAFSSGLVEVYSLPHPEALSAHRKAQVKDYQSDAPTLCKVECVLQLQVGSIKSCGENSQCFTLAWAPRKPHQHLAAGFYNGTVSIWDLKTKSALQRVRNGHVLRQYPFISFQAHEHAVRSIEWCKADSNFLVTAGMDRRLKFWDLRRLDEPINMIKRILSTEISWVLPYCGVVMAQDTCYASHGLCGIHYVDSGFLGYKPYFVTPRRGTVWSLSGSDWLGSLTAGDVTGEVIVVVLPNLNVHSINTKRPADRRFPVYKADIEPCDPSPDTAEPATQSNQQEHFKPKSFRAGEGQYKLHFQDTDLRSFQRLRSREPVKRMHSNETKGDHNLERVRLEAMHRVRFCPNLDAHVWVSSGGHAGLVRVHCIRGLSCSVAQKLIQERGAQFRAMFEEVEAVGEPDYSPEVQHRIVQV